MRAVGGKALIKKRKSQMDDASGGQVDDVMDRGGRIGGGHVGSVALGRES